MSLNQPPGKMTGAKALEYALEIEALEEKISAVYAKASEHDGANNINPVREIVELRKDARNSAMMAEGMIEALDLPKDGDE